MTTSNTHNSVWDKRIRALDVYVDREGTPLVPTKHIETVDGSPVSLGAWVSYVRTRYHNKTLPEHRVTQMESYHGWKWGPLRPGPKPNNTRGADIRKLRENGISLQSIGTKYGLSRQRIHQIVSK